MSCIRCDALPSGARRYHFGKAREGARKTAFLIISRTGCNDGRSSRAAEQRRTAGRQRAAKVRSNAAGPCVGGGRKLNPPPATGSSEGGAATRGVSITCGKRARVHVLVPLNSGREELA